MRRRWLGVCFVGVLLGVVACTGGQGGHVPPPPTARPTVTAAVTPSVPQPSPSPTPSPTPTPTPVAALRLLWPEEVSALMPIWPEVVMHVSPSVPFTAAVRLQVWDAERQPYAQIALRPRGGGHYAASAPLQLPLRGRAGRWKVQVAVTATLPVEGPRTLSFVPRPVRFRDLGDVLHAGVSISVPVAFVEVRAQGGPWAGGRVWRYALPDGGGTGEVSLWWAPGPAESLRDDVALVMVEATYRGEAVPHLEVLGAADWHGLPAYRFRERWPDGDGVGQVWVIQGPDRWLHLLRVRAVGGPTLPPVVAMVGQTLRIEP